MARILVVEDHIDIADLIRHYLERAGHAVDHLASGRDVPPRVKSDRPDLIILDLMLPGMDGLLVCQTLRKDPATAAIPIIMLTARGEEADRIKGFELGADDYVVKPFGMAELLARARVALRRHRRAVTGEPVVKVGALTIDLARRVVLIDNTRVALTPKEYRLLQVLAQHAGNVVTHQHLLREVWGMAHLNDPHYLRIFVRKLRQKIERDPTQPRILLTELGVGYRLAMNATENAVAEPA